MKTDRSFATRAAAVLLAGLLFATGSPAGQLSINLGGLSIGFESSSKKLAKALTQKTQEAKEKFDANRRALRIVPLPGGKQAVARKDLNELILKTKNDVNQAIESLGPKTGPLDAWATEEIQRIQGALPRTRTAASFSTPRAVAVVASLKGIPLGLASIATAAPQPETVPVETSNQLLDQVGNVISRIFFLASHDDLEVKLWVGSPAKHTTFTFWPQGQAKGSAPEHSDIRLDGTKSHVFRGLYAYNAIRIDGVVADLVQYPNPEGAPAAKISSEPLDLVNGTSFFCCRFDEHYCQHVASEKECQP
jgi:hypothetical protein